MSLSPIQKISSLTHQCFGREGDLADLVVGMMSEEGKTRACSFQALESLLAGGDPLSVPPSGLPLIRQAYFRRGPQSHDRFSFYSRLPLLKLAARINPPPPDALSFWEEALRVEHDRGYFSEAMDLAYETLRKFGSEADPVVIRLLEDQVLHRGLAAQALAHPFIATEWVRPLIRETARQQKDYIAHSTDIGEMEFLVQSFGSQAETMRELLTLYSEEGLFERMYIVKLFSFLREIPVAFYPLLLDNFKKGVDEDLSRWTQDTLSKSNLRQTIHHLIAAMESEDDNVCQEVIETIGMIGNSRSRQGIPDLSDLVFQLTTKLEHKSEKIREAAVWALGSLGEGAYMALPLLGALMMTDEVESCRFEAREAIEEIEEDVF